MKTIAEKTVVLTGASGGIGGQKVLRSIELLSVFFTSEMSIKDVGHQCGTCRFGEDPKTSVLDLNCRTHDIDNLYVVDGSFFPSSAALNPTLTIIANAIRVGEHLMEKMCCSERVSLNSYQSV